MSAASLAQQARAQEAQPPEAAAAPAPEAVAAPAPAAPAPVPVPAPTAAPTAAPAKKPEPPAEGMGQFLLGAAVFDLSELNDRLENAGYESLDEVVTILGGEGHGVLESGFYIGGRGAAILAPSGDGPGDLRTHLSGGYGVLDLGFALVHTQAILCTLAAGIGGYGLSLEIVDEQSVRFDAVLRDPERGTELSTGGLLGSLTLGLDGRVPIGERVDGRRGFFTLGLRAGALYGPPMGSWSLPQGADASSGPSTTLLGAYAALAIGFGGGNLH